MIYPIQALTNGICTISSVAVDSYVSLGRKIAKITNDHLPPTVAKIIQCIFWSLPTTLGLIFFPLGRIPTYVFIGALFLLSPEGIRQDLGDELASGVYAGIRNVSLLQAGVDLILLDRTHDMEHIAHLAVNIFFALMGHVEANPTIVLDH